MFLLVWKNFQGCINEDSELQVTETPDQTAFNKKEDTASHTSGMAGSRPQTKW